MYYIFSTLMQRYEESLASVSAGSHWISSGVGVRRSFPVERAVLAQQITADVPDSAQNFDSRIEFIQSVEGRVNIMSACPGFRCRFDDSSRCTLRPEGPFALARV